MHVVRVWIFCYESNFKLHFVAKCALSAERWSFSNVMSATSDSQFKFRFCCRTIFRQRENGETERKPLRHHIFPDRRDCVYFDMENYVNSCNFDA